jgi:hypothetical protein
VLSRDGAGRGFIYFPMGPRAEHLEGGVEQALPLATRLDATLGEEQLFALACDQPVELEPLRAALEAGQPFAAPGCQVIPWRFAKR